MVQREDPLVAEFRRDYARLFRDAMTMGLGVWRQYHEMGATDRLGYCTPSSVVSQSHRVAWEMALERTDMNARIMARRREGWPDPDFSQLELSLYWDAIQNIAPTEWRSQFLGKPPPGRKRGGGHGDHSGDH